MSKKALVTGGAGFIGSNLIRSLVDLNYEVVSYDNYTTGNTSNHIKGVKYHKQDASYIQYSNVKYDYVFHLAALSRVQPSFESPFSYFKHNVELTHIICDYVYKFDSKLIFAGSSSIHQNETSPYSQSKLMAENIIKMYKNIFGINADIARFYNVYGPGEITQGKMATVIGKFRQLVLDNKPLTIVGDGHQVRSFTHVDDIVNGLITISQNEKPHHDAWELGSFEKYSINEVAKLFNHPLEYIEDQPGNYRSSSLKNDDAYRHLGWSPKNTLKNYINSICLP